MEASAPLHRWPAETAGRLSSVALPRLLASHNQNETLRHDWYPEYSLPAYTSEVDTAGVIDKRPRLHEGFGVEYPHLIPMADGHGTSYRVHRFIADKPRTDIWVIKDTAWSTQPGGINTDVARKLMHIGFNVLIKGPEISSSIPQSQSAFHTHKVLDYFEARGDIQARQLALEGYSRGAMVGFGTNAYAREFGRRILYSNLTDPCVALPIGRNLETIKKGLTLPLDIALLNIDVIRGIMDRSTNKRFKGTVDPSLEGLKQFIKTGGPLMNGEAGMMAARTPLDMQATIAFFRGCRVNDKKVFRAILADHKGVRFVDPEGGHGKGLDARIIGNIAVRFQRLADQIVEGRTPDELEYRRIHLTEDLKLAS